MRRNSYIQINAVFARVGVKDQVAMFRAAALGSEVKSVSVVLSNGKPIGIIALRDGFRYGCGIKEGDSAVMNNRVSDVAVPVKLYRRAMAVIRRNNGLALSFKAVFLVTTVLGVRGPWVAIPADTGAAVRINTLRLLRD